MKQFSSTIRLAYRMKSYKLLLSALMILYSNAVSYYRCKAYSNRVFDSLVQQRMLCAGLEELENETQTEALNP